MLAELHEAISKGASDLVAPTTGDGDVGGNAELVTAPEELEMLEEEVKPGPIMSAVNMQRVPITQKLASVVFEIRKVVDTVVAADPGYGYAWWNPKTKHVWGVTSDGDDRVEGPSFYEKLEKLDGIEKVDVESEVSPPDAHDEDSDWIRIKRSDTLPQARRKVDTNPTEAQQEVGNYRKGHFRLHGLDITLENPKGSTRSGTDPDGKSWSVKLQNDYGYFKRSKGNDDDQVDVFIGANPESELAFVINQVQPGTDKLDEHKVVLGTVGESEARKTYLANYEKGWDGLGSICPITIPQLKWWLENGEMKKPIENGMFAKKAFVFSCCGQAICSGCPGGSELMTPEWYAIKWAAERDKVVAVDVDGTLAQHYDEFDPEVIPPPRRGAKREMERVKDVGATIIINTVRGDNDVTKDWLEEHDIPFDHINHNPDQPEGASDKLMADVYLDDKAVPADQPLRKAVDQVLEKISLADLHASIDVNRKSAQTPYWQQGLQTQFQQPSWNMNRGLLPNLWTNVQQAKDTAQRRIRDRDFADDFQSELQPGFALRRFQNYMRHGDHVQDPLDKVMFRNEPLF